MHTLSLQTRKRQAGTRRGWTAAHTAPGGDLALAAGFSVPRAERVRVLDRLYILEQVYVYGKVERKVQRFPKYPLPPPLHAPTSVVHLSQLVTLHRHQHHTQCVVGPGAHLGGVCSVGLDKCVTAHFHHGVVQVVVTALQTLCALPVRPSSPQPLATTDLSTASMVLPFSECPTVGIVQGVAFSDWFLSPGSARLRFPQASSWFGSAFLFSGPQASFQQRRSFSFLALFRKKVN